MTAPYLHNGRLASLAEVVDQWNAGEHLERQANDSNPSRPISLKDRPALLAFLATLTDHRLLHDQRFAEPAPIPPSPRERFAHSLESLFSMRAEAAAPRLAPLQPSPNLAISTEALSVVVVRSLGNLLLYIDEIATNAPIEGLAATVIASGQVLHGKALGNGVYAIPADRLDPLAPQPLSIRLRGPGVELTLQGELRVDSASRAMSSADDRFWTSRGFVVLVAAVGALFAARLWSFFRQR